MRTLFIFIALLSVLAACSEKRPAAGHADHAHEQPKPAPEKYTCPMHPAVVQDGPGKCPICGMDLVPKKAGIELMLSENQMRLANITTAAVASQPVGQTIVINGKLALNEEGSSVISSRAAGRVEKLFLKETGRPVKKGEPLYELYSETLLTLQREYLLAKAQYDALGKENPRYATFLKSAEQKLLRYGLTPAQVDQLGKSKVFKERITFLAPASGLITSIRVAEGQYVEEGAALYQLENIGTLWLEAETYPQETSLVKVGDMISVRVNGYEATPVEAKVTFLSPEYRANTVVTVLRATLANPNEIFKPGMQAQVLFTHSSRQALALPTDAVIRDAHGAHVYVQTLPGTFEPREVETGLEDFGKVEITSGLSEGDTVAVTGAYLLYSEIVLKKGGDPMAVHQHE
ncbi:membrane fusion protein, Cu(I)/Ag(I) efflux system [Chryseolinea serpens]|uniref:Membrane fusion protein, Cu(I)/Ag(I) efflux system n=1 Tax=Chryseolinea serpens TaxID=947013 RepID=A0A1M5LCP9_9BACT|nr:efflux RND transporter periplasmic adaptor subunit [Chryseolinea serpens]SHG62183.1 membrane fusion protein, Cu(I)/Ag(I) efflux system [Chryseolinea serpens]